MKIQWIKLLEKPLPKKSIFEDASYIANQVELSIRDVYFTYSESISYWS